MVPEAIETERTERIPIMTMEQLVYGLAPRHTSRMAQWRSMVTWQAARRAAKLTGHDQRCYALYQAMCRADRVEAYRLESKP